MYPIYFYLSIISYLTIITYNLQPPDVDMNAVAAVPWGPGGPNDVAPTRQADQDGASRFLLNGPS